MAMFDPHSGKIRVTREVVRFTPMQQDVVKFLALVLMVVDHANRALGLHEPVLMLLGRGAFPLFALLWGYNLAQRPVSQSQANRLWLWSFLAQPAYWLALRHSGFFWYDPNILFVFAVVTQALVFAWRPTGRGEPHGVVVAVAIVGLWGVFSPDSSYGWVGALMLLTSYGLSVSLPDHIAAEWPVRGYAILSWPCLVLALNAGLGSRAMVAGLLLSVGLMLASLPLYQPVDVAVARRWLPRGFFLNAYVAHLLVLAVVGWFFH